MEQISEILGRLRGGDEHAISELFDLMARIIYNYPRVRNRARLVDGAEFYCYVWSRLKDGRRISSYDPARGKFEVWFATVLENLLNTLISQKLTAPTEKLAETDEIDELLSDDPTADELIELEQDKDAIERFVEEMNDTERVVVLMTAVCERGLQPAELEMLARYRHSSIEETAAKLLDLLIGEAFREEQRLRTRSEQLKSLFRSITKLQSKAEQIRQILELEKEARPSDNERIHDLETQLEKCEYTECKKREKYSQLSRVLRRDGSLVALKNREIAAFLGVNLGTVTSAMARLREKYRKWSLQQSSR